MTKTVLLTGATDGIGVLTAEQILAKHEHLDASVNNAGIFNQRWFGYSYCGQYAGALLADSKLIVNTDQRE